jgi:hypothetical protein
VLLFPFLTLIAVSMCEDGWLVLVELGLREDAGKIEEVPS